MRTLLTLGALLVGAFGAPTGGLGAEHPLERICRFLESGTPNQVAAARRSLWEEVGSDDVAQLRQVLAGSSGAPVVRALQARLFALLSQDLTALEENLQRFDDARANANRIAAQLAPTETDAGPAPGRGDAPPTDASEPEPEAATGAVPEAEPDSSRADLVNRLQELRGTRNRTRREIRTAYDALLTHEFSLVPVVFERLRGGTTTPVVQRFYDRLVEDLLARVEQRIAVGAAGDSREVLGKTRFEQRCLAPLLATLVERHGPPWDELREELATAALRRLETYEPEEVREARQLFLELGAWGIERLDRWAAESQVVPSEVRRLYAAWNRLGAPVDLASQSALPIADYTELPPESRQRLIYRLEWVAGKQGVPVFARLLYLEPDLSLQVEVAAALSRLEDSRGAEFLRRLGLENSVELDSISRQVLIIEAIHRRESGDTQGALNDLLAMLRRFPADHRVHYEIAFTALLARQLELAIEHFREATRLEPTDSLAYYNLGCTLALAGRPDPAIDALELAVRHGFKDLAHLRNDVDLQSLRGLPRFAQLLQSLE
ncbi:MAG: tetratricopeptide repeat protein [Planctomycetota bacterium]